MLGRRRFKQTDSLEHRLSEHATRLREDAKHLRPGAERDDALRKARQNEAAAHMSEWLRSPNSQPPR